MTNTLLLENRIKSSGIKYKFIAEKMGLTYYSLRKKMDNVTEFTATEIDVMCDLLNLNVKDRMAIFFAKIVDLKSTKN